MGCQLDGKDLMCWDLCVPARGSQMGISETRRIGGRTRGGASPMVQPDAVLCVYPFLAMLEDGMGDRGR